MKVIYTKRILFIIVFLLIVHNFYPLIENNDYNDAGLLEKTGTFGINTHAYSNYASAILGVGNNDYSEFGAHLNLLIDYPELSGFFFNANFLINRLSLRSFQSKKSDIGFWGNFVPFFGENYLGYRNKFLSFKFGFQYLNSSDAIYNHLFIDDYSGSFFAMRIDLMLSRFLDFQLVYTVIRPQEGTWYTGDSVNNIKKTGLYGKSLYFEKVNFRPIPWIRIGIENEVYFRGENFNHWFSNPFFPYFASQMIGGYIANKYGSSVNTDAANILLGADFNIGFSGWRLYGELLIDDMNGEYVRFDAPAHPDKIAFLLGGEIRGYLFTKYFSVSKLVDFFASNLYVNFEYGTVSKYTFARDPNFYYEYVRDEYKKKYDQDNPPSDADVTRVNRIGNFIGFMYGPNSDCFDFAIGWRNDLKNVKEYRANYQADLYFKSQKKEKKQNRLFKIQMHYRHYRLGDERNVILPFYANEHWYYDMDGDGVGGTDRRTEFLKVVLEEGNILDLHVYSDILRIARFVIGAETKFNFSWKTTNPWTNSAVTTFSFQWQIGLTIYW